MSDFNNHPCFRGLLNATQLSGFSGAIVALVDGNTSNMPVRKAASNSGLSNRLRDQTKRQFRLGKVLTGLVKVPTGRIDHAFRRVLARKLFIGRSDRVIIGTRVEFGSGANVETGTNSNIGRNSWIANDTVFREHEIHGPEMVIMSYSQGTEIDRTPFDPQGYTRRRPLIVKDNVRIGTRAILLPGVTVRGNSVIGAEAMVTKEAMPFSVAAGNPARIVKSLGTEHSKPASVLDNSSPGPNKD